MGNLWKRRFLHRNVGAYIPDVGGKTITKNSGSPCSLSNFKAENITNGGPFKPKNNEQSILQDF